MQDERSRERRETCRAEVLRGGQRLLPPSVASCTYAKVQINLALF